MNYLNVKKKRTWETRSKKKRRTIFAHIKNRFMYGVDAFNFQCSKLQIVFTKLIFFSLLWFVEQWLAHFRIADQKQCDKHFCPDFDLHISNDVALPKRLDLKSKSKTKRHSIIAPQPSSYLRYGFKVRPHNLYAHPRLVRTRTHLFNVIHCMNSFRIHSVCVCV